MAPVAQSLDELFDPAAAQDLPPDLYVDVVKRTTRKSPILNVFCKTGQGGGIDPSCGGGTTGGSTGGMPPAVSAAFANLETKVNDVKSKSEAFRLVKQAERDIPNAARAHADAVVSAALPGATEGLSRREAKVVERALRSAAKDYKEVIDFHLTAYSASSDTKERLSSGEGRKAVKQEIEAMKEQFVKDHKENREVAFGTNRVGYLKDDLVQDAYVTPARAQQIAEKAFKAVEDKWDKAPTANVFCKTGPGGGIDPTCGGTKIGASGQSSTPKYSDEEVVAAFAHYQTDGGFREINETLRGKSGFSMDEKDTKTYEVLKHISTTEVIGSKTLYRGLGGETGQQFLQKIGLDVSEYEARKAHSLEVGTLKQTMKSFKVPESEFGNLAQSQGIDLSKSTDFLGTIRQAVGKTVEDKGFMSTTTSSKSARDFANEPDRGGGSNHVVLVISTTKNQTGVDLTKHTSLHEDEKEIILPPNTKIKVTDIEQSSQGWKISVDVVPTSNGPDDVRNVFCKTGQGGGIDPTCKVGGGTSTPATMKEIAIAFHSYNAAPPEGKSTLAAGQGLTGTPSVEEFRAHLLSKAEQYHNPEPVTKLIERSTAAHDGARQRVAALDDKIQAIERQRESISEQLKPLGLRDPARPDLEKQRHGLLKQQEVIKTEARELITAHLKERNGREGNTLDSGSIKTGSPLSQRALKTDVEATVKFLDGAVRKGPDGKPLDPVAAHYEVGVRPNYDPKNKAILTKTNDPVAMIHEFGHHIEYNVSGVQKASQDFLAHRVGTEEPTKLREKYPGKEYGYHDGDVGKKDDFAKAAEDERRAYYVGKTYKDGGTEVVSMSLETMYANPTKMAKQDPEWFNFTMGVLGGEARRKPIPKE